MSPRRPTAQPDPESDEVTRAAAPGVDVFVCRRESAEARLHRAQLDGVLAKLAETEADWPAGKVDWLTDSAAAFEEWRERDNFPLTDKQVAWLEKVADALELDLPRPASRGPVPKGKPVTLVADQLAREAEAAKAMNPNAPNFWKPLKPPGRK